MSPNTPDQPLNSYYRNIHLRTHLLALANLLLFITAGLGANGTWTNLAGGIWGTTTNWSGGTVANGIDAIADFSTLDITAARTINLGANFTVGNLIFADAITASNNWTLANGTGGPWALTLATSTGTPTINVVNQTTTISAVLAGTQGFTKSGAGALTLTGANTLTGGINLSAGTLNFGTNSLGTNVVDFTAAATLGWNGTTTQDVSALIKIEDGVTATLAPGANNVTFATALQTGAAGTGAITKTGAGTITITAANTYTGLTKINVGRITLSGGNNRLAITGTIGLGQGANSGVLQLGDASGAVNQTTTSLTITGTGTANAVVGGNASVSTLTINNSAAVTYAGLLGGTGTNENNLALVKTGSAALTLSNTGSTFTGGVTLNQGTITHSAGSLGTTGLITYAGTSSLQWATGNTSDLSSRIKIGDGIIATVDTNGNNVTFANALQTGALGTGALTKGGTGALTISAVNTFTGATRVNNGRIILTGGADNRLASTALQFGNAANSGVLQLGDAAGTSNQTFSSFTINGTGTANAIVGGNSSNSTLTVNNTAATSFAGLLGGAGTNENNLALTKTGAGAFTLSNASNTFAGNVAISGGTLAVTKSGALGSGTKTVTISGATADAPSLKIDGTAGDINLASSLTLVTSNDNATTPAILSSAGNNVIAGNIAPTSGGFGGGQTRIAVTAGTLTLNGSIAPNAGAVSARTLILDGTANGTANGAIADNGAISLGVTKEGLGTWTLTAANSYTGATTINAGRLNTTTSQTGGGALTVGDNATLGLTLSAAGQSLTTSSLTLGATTGGTVSFNLGGLSNPTAPLISASSFATNGANTLNIAGTGLSVGVFDLVSYTGSIGGSGFAGLTLGTTPARVTANLVDAVGKVQLNISAFDVPKWTGAVDGNWDINDGADPTTGLGTVNWKEANSGTATRYLQIGNTIDSVLFDDSATGTKNVNLTSALTPTTATVNNSLAGGDYTFSGSGKLSGATNLVKQGTGKLILANTGGNDYTGTTTISGGTLQVGDGVTLFAGQLGSGAISIGASGTLALNRPLSDDYTLANIISGAGSIVQQGGNTVTINGNNLAYDGTITVSSGVIRIGSANALGTAVGGVNISGTGALEITGQTVADAVQLSTGGTLRAFSGTSNIVNGVITLNGGGVLDGLNSTTLTINTAIAGTGGLTKAGNGLAILLADNTYSGGTTISGGTLQIGATTGSGTTGSLPTGDITFNPASGTATLTILRGDSALNISNNITSSGAGTNAIVIGNASGLSGTVTFSGSNTFTGNVTITGGALKITNSSALGIGTKTVSIGNASRPGLLLDGSGGDLTLVSGIGFAISSDGGVVNTTSNPGAIVNVAGHNVINGNIALVNGGGGNGKIVSQAGTLTINGNIDSTGATGVRTLLLGGAADGTINGLTADASFVTSLTKDGNGTWTLNGTNTFTGAVTVSAGTLRVNAVGASGSAQPLGAGAAVVTLGNATTAGTLDYSGNADATLGRGITVGGVAGGIVKNSGSGVLTLSGTITRASRPFTFQGGAFNVTGQITGASSTLNVEGANVTLSQTTNNYVGGTNVYSGGVLKNGASQVLTDGTTLTLGEATNNTGGTYDLNGFSETVTGIAGAGTGSKIITNNGTDTSTLTVTGTSSYDGVIQDGATGVTALAKTTGGTLTLSGNNTFTGAITISAGTLSVSSINALGAGSAAITLGSASAGTLLYTDGSATLSRDITVTGAGGGFITNSGTGTLTLAGAISKDGTKLTLGGGSFNVTGQITGASANSDLIVNSGATVTLSNANNTYNGPTVVSGGATLKNGVTNALPSGTTITLGESTNNTAGTYDLNGYDATVTGVTTSGSGAHVVTNSGASGTNTLTVTGTLSYGGTIQDGTTAKTALTKSGSGTYSLTGVNSYTGDTTVTGGTLDLSSPALITSNAIAKVGGALAISGTVNGNVTIETGGSLYAGGTSVTGLSTINGGLVLNSASDVFFDLGGTTRGASTGGYDGINGLTQLTLAGTLHVGFINGFTAAEGDVFNLIDWTSLAGNVTDNTFAFDFGNAAPGSNLEWNTASFLTTGSISLVASAAPEPGRALLLFTGLTALIIRRRR